MSQRHGRFEDALFQQTQQLRFLESTRGRWYMDSFQRDFMEKRPGSTYPPGAFYALAVESVRRADPVYVSPDVTEIIDHSLKTFEPEPILPSDPFIPCGFAYFPRSIRFKDRKGVENGVRAIGWLPIQGDGRVAPEGGEYIGLWVSWFAHESDGSGDEDPLPYRKLHPLMELQFLHGTFVPFNAEGWTREMMGDADGIEYEEAIRQQWILPQVMWRIGQQIVPSKERPARSFRRDAARHGLLQDEVAVLRLRRSSIRYEGEGESEVEWDHRWLVQGHWRNQHYPTLGPPDDPAAHRQIWINPYVKGPDDKPLILKDRAVEFVR